MYSNDKWLEGDIWVTLNDVNQSAILGFVSEVITPESAMQEILESEEPVVALLKKIGFQLSKKFVEDDQLVYEFSFAGNWTIQSHILDELIRLNVSVNGEVYDPNVDDFDFESAEPYLEWNYTSKDE